VGGFGSTKRYSSFPQISLFRGNWSGLILNPLKNEMNKSKPGNTGEIGGNRLLGMLAENSDPSLIG